MATGPAGGRWDRNAVGSIPRLATKARVNELRLGVQHHGQRAAEPPVLERGEPARRVLGVLPVLSQQQDQPASQQRLCHHARSRSLLEDLLDEVREHLATRPTLPVPVTGTTRAASGAAG